MSNQVYSNEERKYYALPGMNAYIMSADQIVGTAILSGPNVVPSEGSFLFTTVGSIVNDNSLITISPTSLQVLKPGMYSINLMIGIESNESPRKDLEMLFKMILSRVGTLNGIDLDFELVRDIDRGADLGADARFHTLKYIGFLDKNDIINFQCFNYATGAVKLLKSECQLNINKIY